MAGEVVPEAAGDEQEQGYTFHISRLTIDELGRRFYDQVSAVVAELIANGHDADADNVWVELPLNTLLADKEPESVEPVDKGYEIVVRDDGHGMTPWEAQSFYLVVGRDRRKGAGQGDRSRIKKRQVMGRKGIGKFVPFGICRKIEIISSGGDPVPGRGYLTTHFFVDFEKLLQDTDTPVSLHVGPLDGTCQPESGTTIRLTSFLPKRVPRSEDFHRQLAVRFAFANPEFRIHIRNTRGDPPEDSDVEQFQVETNPDTRIDVSDRPVLTEDGERLPVRGWVAMAKQPHRYQELAGVRIYARGKIVDTTRDFGQPAGFTGDYIMSSYLVGEIEANWLDEKEDLVRTDREGILWKSDLGSALRTWGAQLIKEVAKKSARPRRESVDEVISLLNETKLAEMVAYARVAAERVATIVSLKQQLARTDVAESELQALISSAPWLIRPDWSVLTANEQLRTFRDRFVRFFRLNYGQDVDVAVSYETKRPDFTLIQHGSRLRVVELKAPGHSFNDADYERLQNYVVAFTRFFEENRSMNNAFPAGWQIDLIADTVNIGQTSYMFAFNSFERQGQVVRISWDDFLLAAVQAHEQILEIYNSANAAGSQ